MTAHADEERFQRAKLVIPFGYIIKPFQDRELKTTIEMALYKVKVDTETRKAQIGLHESEEKYRVLFKSASDAVFLVDVETLRLMDANDAAVALYGYSHEELLKMKAVDLSAETQETEKAIKSDMSTTVPVRYHKKKDGTVFPVEISATFLTHNSKRINFSNIRDISARMAAEEKNELLQTQLQQSQKMESIGVLAAGIAHEINNPIGFVKSNIETLSDYFSHLGRLMSHYHHLMAPLRETEQIDLPGDIRHLVQVIDNFEKSHDIGFILEDIHDLLKDCKEGASRINEIVGGLKSFTHPGNAEQTLININECLSSTLNVIHNELKYKAEVVKDFNEVLPVEGYQQKLIQVFMNFLVNAAQAIEKKGKITIRTGSENNHTVISISDTGSGIKKDDIPKVFDPFFTTKEVGKGTGLGMNIAYNIIREHDGEIDVESFAGKGTTFTITLPGVTHE